MPKGVSWISGNPLDHTKRLRTRRDHPVSHLPPISSFLGDWLNLAVVSLGNSGEGNFGEHIFPNHEAINSEQTHCFPLIVQTGYLTAVLTCTSRRPIFFWQIIKYLCLILGRRGNIPLYPYAISTLNYQIFLFFPPQISISSCLIL